MKEVARILASAVLAVALSLVVILPTTAFHGHSHSKPDLPNKITVMVPMRDGVRLSTDAYLPEGSGPWPVIVVRTPYNKNWHHVSHMVVELKIAVVVQDMRGRFESEGVSRTFRTDGWGKLRDGYDTIAWVKGQSWCNGKIGTMGGSALGIVQNLLAPTNPPGLVAQQIAVAPSSMYEQAAYQGGELRKEQVEGWTEQHSFPQENIDTTRAHPNYDDTWHDVDTTWNASKCTVPALYIGGWYDTFCQGTIDSFLARQHRGSGKARGNCMLIMGPWTHMYVTGRSPVPLLYPGSSFPPDFKVTDWFGYWLKGDDTGIMNKPRVWYYTMGAITEPGSPGNVWQSADDWPPPSESRSYYFSRKSLLTTAALTASGASRSFDYDPRHPVPTIGGRNLIVIAGPFDQQRIEKRADILLFDTKPLAKPLEVTGRILVDLYASSSAPDTDFTAKLCDVYPNGQSIEIADGIIRAASRNTYVKDEPIVPGQVYEYRIDLWSTSRVFNKGHRIRVEISSSNYPRFEINPNTGKRYQKGDPTQVARQTVYFDADHPSCLILPVVTNSKVAR